MSIAIVGLGSMGKRRIRNLYALGEREMVGVDSRADRREEAAKILGVRTVSSLEEALTPDVTAVVVSTPPDQHDGPALAAARLGKHVFMEASVFETGFDELEALQRARGLVIAPSCTMKFHPAIRTAKRVIDSGEIGRVVAFTHHCGQHLKLWHPWEQYQEFYVSRRETGGCREMVPFELVWLTWLCGNVESVSSLRGQVGELGVDVDDVYQLLLRFESGCLGHLLVDILQLAGNRHSRFVCTKGVITWNWDRRSLHVYRADGTWREYPDVYTQTTLEGFYIDEMATFLAATRGTEVWPHSLAEDRRILGLLLAAEASSDGNRHIAVGPAVAEGVRA